MKGLAIMAIEENPFNHILYEFNMYLQPWLFPYNDQFILNLLIDSRMVHLRNLAYFFDDKKDCDIHASVYVKHPQSCLIEHKQLKGIYHVTNCSACHMSFERLKPSFKQKTTECAIQALAIMSTLIKNYFDLLETDLKPEYATLWKDGRIQVEANNTRKLLANLI